MAIELCSDDSTPRISFSHDISQTNTIPIPVQQYIRSTNNSSSSTIDFDFCVLHQSFDLDQSSSADELFFNGKILPIEMKKKIIAPTLPLNKGTAKSHKLVSPSSNTCFNNENLIETKSHKLVAPGNTCFKNENLIETKSGILETSSSSSSDDQKHNSNNSKSFWNFNRSRSLNCGTSYARTLCPLPLLSRSNSTPSVKHKQHSQKSSSSISTGQYQKPPLRKISSNTYNNGIKINSVLNVPPSSFFGLSSIFSIGKERYKKR